jgi:Ca-activated chloride channel family protein
MFRFEHIEYLYLLLLVPVIALLMLYQFRKWRSKRKKLSDSKLLERLIPDWKSHYKWIRFGLILSFITLLIITLSNPQWATKREKVKAMASDVFIALDISQSMMVQDIPPNRLERAKKLVEQMILALKGNRIGLIFFAGEAYIQMPLTADYAAALMFLKSANPGQIASQGTAIVEAIQIADESFSEDKDHQRALVIITDGEDHDGEAVAKAKAVYEQGMHVFTYGVGTAEGDFVPYTNQMGVESYKMDQNGEFVKSKVNIQLLDEIASAGGGKYFSILGGESTVDELVRQLENIEKREMEQRSFTAFDSYFQYFLIIGILFLVLEFVSPERLKTENV